MTRSDYERLAEKLHAVRDALDGAKENDDNDIQDLIDAAWDNIDTAIGLAKERV